MSKEEFQRDILKVAKQQSEKIKGVIEMLKKHIKNEEQRATTGKEDSNFRCIINVLSVREVALPPAEFQKRLKMLNKEMSELMERYEISTLSASLVKKYEQKKAI